MVNDLMDSYALRARYAPALITFFPSILFISLLIRKIGFNTEIIIGSSLLSGISLPLLLSEICRGNGKKLQDKNYDKWSGEPTTILLKKQNNHFDEVTKEKIYYFIYKDFGINLNLDNSDHNISNAVKRIIKYLRDNKKDELLQIHNIEYGFSRNLAGSNFLFAIQAAFLCIITYVYYFLNNSYTSINLTDDSNIVPLLFLLMLLLSLILENYYYPSMVKSNAFRYAETLLESYYSYSMNKHKESSIL